DTRSVLPNPPDRVRDRELPDGRWQDEWGVVRRLSPDGYYYDLDVCPMAGDPDLEVLERHPWPDPEDPGRYRGLKERVETLRKETDFAIVGHAPGGWVHTSQYLRGFEGWYADLALRPDFATALMEKIRDLVLKMAARFLEEVGPYLDVVATGDDIGAQRGLMISPAMYRELILPLQREQFRTIRAHTDAKIFYHTCGDIYPVLDDLVELGVEILNPVQVSAAEMGDTERLKREYGDRLSFWGGVDTFEVLPKGTPEDVRAEVDRRVEVLGRGGGYVLNAVHNLQPDVPVENIIAMYEHGKTLRY
ncbi:MAG: uroporphyrinogen decarboxylase family protein, partial [Candidatus Latescibacteria bacterium]|nr:uroporphyrinogen decarboxylase family protein [Candidatus Latescibacterota bacterium]